MKKIAAFFVTLLLSTCCYSETFINTVGSDERVAIAGFDPVAFFVDKRAVTGKPEFEFEYLGAKWRFESKEHRDLFNASPDKFMPEWGGQCAWCVSENCISAKKINGDFEFVEGKLYLFAFGNNSRSGAKDDFLYGRWSRTNRILDGERNWSELKKKLESGKIVQKNSSNYKKTMFEQ